MQANGPVALLVGAGDAIGAAVARRFAAEKFQVCVARRDAAKAQTLIDEVAAAGGSVRAFSVAVMSATRALPSEGSVSVQSAKKSKNWACASEAVPPRSNRYPMNRIGLQG